MSTYLGCLPLDDACIERWSAILCYIQSFQLWLVHVRRFLLCDWLSNVDVKASCAHIILARAKFCAQQLFTWLMYIRLRGIISSSFIGSDLPWLGRSWRRNWKRRCLNRWVSVQADSDAHHRWGTIAHSPVRHAPFAVRVVSCCLSFEVVWFSVYFT